MNIHQASPTLPHTQTSATACAQRATSTCRSRRCRAAVVRTNPHPRQWCYRLTRLFPQCYPIATNKACDLLDVSKHDLSGSMQGSERLREEQAKLEYSSSELDFSVGQARGLDV